jgi:hypothetical protein
MEIGLALLFLAVLLLFPRRALGSANRERAHTDQIETT